MEVQQLLFLKRLIKKMTENEIPWINCVGFGVDNPSVSIGKYNSIKTRVLEKNPKYTSWGVHVIFFTTLHVPAHARFRVATGLDVDDFCIDCYYFFENSSKRKGVLTEFCEFVDVEYREILKHINVWWNLERAVGGILSQYEPLNSYFLSESDSSPRFKWLQKTFSEPVTEVDLMFFHAVMSMFTTPNRMLQREDLCLYIIDDIINYFLKVVQARFVKVRVLKDADGRDKVDYEDPDNQLPDEYMEVGFLAKQKVQKLLDEAEIAPGDSRKFFNATRAFYTCRLLQKPHASQ